MPESTQWRLGTIGDGKSCQEICAEADQVCASSELFISTKQDFQNILESIGVQISIITGRSDWAMRPFCNNAACWGYGDASDANLSCSALCSPGSQCKNHRRLCPCQSNFHSDRKLFRISTQTFVKNHIFFKVEKFKYLYKFLFNKSTPL